MLTARPSLGRPFWLLTAARGFSTLASNMLAILIGWSIFHQTHSNLALGLAGLAEAVPAIGLALWAGWLVDRGDALALYRRTMLAHVGLATLPLLALGLGERVAPGGFLATLYLASVIAGAARSFLQPCLYTLVPRLVPRAQLAQAASYSSAVLQAARVLGPGLGGLAYAHAGLGCSLGLVVAFLLLGLLALAPLSLPPASEGAPGVAQAKGRELLVGLRFVLGHPVLLPALSLDMVCVLFSGVTAVLPAFAEELLQAGPTALGWLRAAPAMGAVVGSLLLTRIDVRPRAGAALLASVAGYGLCMVSFALSRSLELSFGLLLLSGLLDSVSVQVRQLVVQLMSPDAMRGRISAVNSMFIGSSNELGEFESGLAAWWLGLVPSVLWGCSLCMLFVTGMAIRARTLRQLDLREGRSLAAPAA